MRPIRILLSSTDRRLQGVVATLLVAKGHCVISSERPSELLALVERHNADVAVIDATGALTLAATAAAALRGLPTPVSAILVGDQARHRSVGALAVLAKWDSFDVLLSRVEESYFSRWEKTA